MNKNKRHNLGLGIPLLLIISATCFLGTMFSQSVVELARQERAKKQKPAAGKVFTNEDIATTPPPAPAPAATDKKAEGDKTADKEKDAGKEKEKSAEDMAKLEKEYRTKFASLRDAQALEEKKLDVMQRELNLNQTQFYTDPNVALREQTFRTQINQQTQDIELQKAAVEKAKKAVSDLEEELQKKNLPAGWSR